MAAEINRKEWFAKETAFESVPEECPVCLGYLEDSRPDANGDFTIIFPCENCKVDGVPTGRVLVERPIEPGNILPWDFC